MTSGVIAMRVEISLPTNDSQQRAFLTWVPVKATARIVDASGAPNPSIVTLKNGGTDGGGRVVFDLQRSDAGAEEIQLQLPTNGTPVEFWVAGQFQHPSSAYGDAAIDVVASGASVGRRELMIRVRKNAVKLSDAERDRFLIALGQLNDAGHGIFQGFRDTHVQQSVDEAHGYPAFPPWHRAYLLDLERSLQAIDATVTLPYWRFDEAAPALFSSAFLGMPPTNPALGDTIQFPHGHPLEFWKTDGTDSIDRRPRFNISGPPPQSLQDGTPWVISQDDTMALGTDYADFRELEFAPHGNAHVSFRGPISRVPQAAKDPLFFLLHANVDRLWAFWQWLNRRTDASDSATYSLGGSLAGNRPGLIGHNLGDTMWPWNQSRTPPRPTFVPPRGKFPESDAVNRPSSRPRVQDMIDYQGVQGGESLGFDYDDVPFELHPGAVA
ncbi:tyrosinase family protein [Bradyrhizobium sp. USDA 10063]